MFKSRRPALRAAASRLLILQLILLILCCPAACQPQEKTDPARLESFRIDSRHLGLSMGVKVYLPPDYDRDSRYPTLYFLPDYGGSDYTVINTYEIGISADKLLADGKIKPMIIVAADTDPSFGLNTAETAGTYETPSGKRFAAGPYEDYIIKEVIPEIDSRYATDAAREGRMIGGYSAGGFAALYLAFTHPDLFCKAGGHSPSLFVADFPDTGVSDWLYPDEATRDRRDPLRLAKTAELTGLAVYLDTGVTDVNVAGCAALYDLLQQRGFTAENHLFDGTHSRSYCCRHMPEYLLFYGGA